MRFFHPFLAVAALASITGCAANSDDSAQNAATMSTNNWDKHEEITLLNGDKQSIDSGPSLLTVRVPVAGVTAKVTDASLAICTVKEVTAPPLLQAPGAPPRVPTRSRLEARRDECTSVRLPELRCLGAAGRYRTAPS